MKTFKIKMFFVIRADDDDTDTVREAVKEKLSEMLEHDELKFMPNEMDEEYEEDEDA